MNQRPEDVEETVEVSEEIAPPGSAAQSKPAASRSIPRNFAVLAAGEALAKVLTFFAFTFVGRVLGPADYGKLEFTLAVMVFFSLSVELGLSTWGAREVARNLARAGSLLRDIAVLRLVLAGGAGLVLAVLALWGPMEGDVRLLLAFYAGSLFVAPVLLHWYFQGHEQMHFVALAQIIRQGTFAALVFSFVKEGTPVYWLGAMECLSVLAAGVFCVAVVVRHAGFPAPEWKFDARRLWGQMREASPIGFSDITWACLWYCSTLLLGLQAAEESLGWFGAAHRATLAVHTFVWFYFFNLLPSISRCAGAPTQTLRRLMARSQIFTAWGGIFVAFVVTMLSQELVTLAYGAHFAEAAAPFSVLIWIIPLSLVSGHYRYTLIAYNYQKLLFSWTAVAALAGALSSWFLIPLLGPTGAALALGGANVIVFVLAYFSVRNRIAHIPFASSLVQPAAAAGAGLLVVFLGGISYPWLRAVVASAVYLAFFFYFERGVIIELLPRLFPRAPWPRQGISEDVKGK
jgi:O-antigen/teichoic acid export membrane protein